MSKSITLGFVGDIMLGRGVNDEIKRKSPWEAALFWDDVLPILKEADAVFANLECAITSHSQQCRRVTKVFHFRADPGAVDVLRAGNIRCVSLANNHTLDFDDQGLLDTLYYLDAVHIHHAGAGQTLHEAMAPAIVSVNDLSIGFIALTDNEIAFAAEPDRPGTYYLEISSEPEVLAIVKTSVEQARQAGATFVILSAHWGPNMITAPPQRFQNFARAAVDCGVDLFYGHSAHLVQAIERYNHRFILYNTGDFLDDYAVDSVLHNDWSFVFLVTLNTDGAHQLKLIPVRLRFARVELARGREFSAICARMRSLCAEFKTPLVEMPDGLVLSLAQ